MNSDEDDPGEPVNPVRFPLTAALPAQRQAFVIHYTGIHGESRATWNAREAAVRAGYSERSAGQIAFLVRHRPEVSAAIEEVMEARRQEYGDTLARTVQELRALAFSQIHDVISCEGATLVVKSMEEIPDEARAAISEIKAHVGSNGDQTIHVKMHSKTAALQMIAKITGGIVDRVAGADGRSPVRVEHSGVTREGMDQLLEAIGMPKQSKDERDE